MLNIKGLFIKKDSSQKENKKPCNCEHVCKPEEYTIKQKSTYARQLFANPLFKIMINDLKAEALEQWENAPARDIDGREMLWTYIKILGQVQAKVDGYITEGIVEAENEKHKGESR